MEKTEAKVLKTGFVSIIGAPNTGKSTFINAVVGYKVAIVTPKPQTTRNRIIGIYNEAGKGQIIFIDTPGIHSSKKLLNQNMIKIAVNSIAETEAILVMLDLTRMIKKEEKNIFSLIREKTVPKIVLLNKTDLIDKKKILPFISELNKEYGFDKIIPVSALQKDGLENVIKELFSILPEGNFYYPEDMYTDLTQRFMVSEIIRERIFNLTYQEIPYSTAVEIETFTERSDKPIIDISVVIFVERDSQKGIIIGKKGELLKKIGTDARIEIEEFLEKKVFLKFFVKVRENWTEKKSLLEKLGLGEK